MSTFDGIVREFPSIRIDNFLAGGTPPLACFLSHVHSDHLKGLESFKSTFIYCTAPTRELLLRLEKYPHRMNFAKGILESRKQTYRRLKNHIKPIPLETPTVIELCPGNPIRVTLFDANHCLGACMFLIEGEGRAVLYTGDIRSEQWWVDSLARNPILLPYTKGSRHLDNIYLDTTFAASDALEVEFPPKAEGLSELIEKASKYPSDTIFYLNTWTFGYEDAWVALSAALNTKVHLDDYRWRLYHSQRDQPTCYGPQTASLVGFKLGNHEHSGCLSNSPEGVRIHSCERGTQCEVFQNPNVVIITPIIARHKGREIAEVGAGGGQGDLNQTLSLELDNPQVFQQLLMMCAKMLETQPQLKIQVAEWFSGLMQKGRESIDLDLEILREEVQGLSQGDGSIEFDLDNLPIDRLVPAFIRLVTGKSKGGSSREPARQITFPYSRHSSYQELREFVQAFRPKDIHPCTVDLMTYTPNVSMQMLFGDLCSANIFQADKDIHAQLGIQNSDSPRHEETQDHSPPSPSLSAEPLHPHVPKAAPRPDNTRQANVAVAADAGKGRRTDSEVVETPGKRIKKITPDRGTPSSADTTIKIQNRNSDNSYRISLDKFDEESVYYGYSIN